MRRRACPEACHTHRRCERTLPTLTERLNAAQIQVVPAGHTSAVEPVSEYAAFEAIRAAVDAREGAWPALTGIHHQGFAAEGCPTMQSMGDRTSGSSAAGWAYAHGQDAGIVGRQEVISVAAGRRTRCGWTGRWTRRRHAGCACQVHLFGDDRVTDDCCTDGHCAPSGTSIHGRRLRILCHRPRGGPNAESGRVDQSAQSA
jgi:hypothetical protein